MNGLKIKNVKTGNVSGMKCKGLFLAIGHDTATRIFKDRIEMDKNGYVVTKGGTKTSAPGVFACGDVYI